MIRKFKNKYIVPKSRICYDKGTADRGEHMKINQIIREKRKELSLTQEQIADYLGVSTPAVNKWEKGSSYPDITLLPALRNC